MNKKQHPSLRRTAKTAVSVTLDNVVLARMNARGPNRSEEINSALARLILIEDGKADMEPEERRRFKMLALRGIHEEEPKQQAVATRRPAQPKPVRNSPWPS